MANVQAYAVTGVGGSAILDAAALAPGSGSVHVELSVDYGVPADNHASLLVNDATVLKCTPTVAIVLGFQMAAGAGAGKVLSSDADGVGTWQSGIGLLAPSDEPPQAGQGVVTVFTTDQTYNGEDMAAGSVLIGDNRAGMGNMLWDGASGRINFRGGTITQAYVDTDGTIVAGGGSVRIDADGVSLRVDIAYDPVGAYRFTDTTGTVTGGSVYGVHIAGSTHSIIMIANSISGQDSLATTRAEAPSTYAAHASLVGVSGATTVSVQAAGELDRVTLTAAAVVITAAAQIATSLSVGTNPADAGTLRLSNAAWIIARNAANSANINMLQVDGSDNLVLGATITTFVHLEGTGHVVANDYFQMGVTDSADAGQIRLKNSQAMVSRNFAGDGNVVLIKANASNQVELGAATLIDGKATLVASGTSAASLNIPAGTAPTAPDAGDLWYDSTKKVFRGFPAGVNQALIGDLSVSTANGSRSNSTDEGSIIGNGVGTNTLPANFSAIGKTLRITARGYYSQTGSPTLRLRLKFAASVVLDTGAFTLSNAATNSYWQLDAVVTCRTIGAIGTLFSQGLVVFTNDTAGSAVLAPMLSTTTVTVDTTAEAGIGLTAQWSAADMSNTITCTNFIAEVIS